MMITKVEQPIAVACLFTWIGFVCAISFMEAWLKFQAPGVTVPIGLGIGRLVFKALNRVEWVFAIAVVGSAIWYNKDFGTWYNGALALVTAILLCQTFWMLPQLDARAQLYITEQQMPASNLHIYFVAAEVVKTGSLLFLGVSLFKPPYFV